MKVIRRYLAREINRAVFFVLLAFLVLLPFFDLPSELQNVGRGGYKLYHAFFFILLGLPSYAYQLMPIAALIGSVYALSQLAARSEFTIMRAASLSTWGAIKILLRVGLVFALLTFVLGEYVAPQAHQWADRIKLLALGGDVSQQFASGWWTKDVIRKEGATGPVIGTRFVNVGEVRPDATLQRMTLYEFDPSFHLFMIISAQQANYLGDKTWRLENVTETRFENGAFPSGVDAAAGKRTDLVLFDVLPTKTVLSHQPTLDVVSEITPTILSVVFSDPDKMSVVDLAIYIRHLAENRQDSERYEIAFWNKLVYPFTVFVMMALALPFAYLHFRGGGTSLKIFVGIMIGVGFVVINNLFVHVGLLNTWPAPVIVLTPSLVFLLGAAIGLWRVEIS